MDKMNGPDESENTLWHIYATPHTKYELKSITHEQRKQFKCSFSFNSRVKSSRVESLLQQMIVWGKFSKDR